MLLDVIIIDMKTTLTTSLHAYKLNQHLKLLPVNFYVPLGKVGTAVVYSY